MFKDKDRELQRLEQALLEQEEDEQLLQEEECDDREWEEVRDHNAYNADAADVDLEEYSDAVWQAKRRLSPLVILACCLTTAILVILVYLFLRFGGYL